MDNINFTAQDAYELAADAPSEEYVKVKRAIYDEALMGHYEKAFESMGYWVQISLEQEGFHLSLNSLFDDTVTVVWEQ